MAKADFSLAACAPDYTSTFILLIGNSQKRLTIHEHVLCAQSSFFREKWQHSPRLGNTLSLSFPDIDYEAMQVLVDWCYRKETALKNPSVDPKKDGDNPNNIRRNQLAQVHLLATMFGMPRLEDDLTDQFRKHSKGRNMDPVTVRTVVDGQLPLCGLLRFIIHDLGYYTSENPQKYMNRRNQWSKAITDLVDGHPVFAQAIFKAHMEFLADETKEHPITQPICFYHNHADDDESCPANVATNDEDTNDE
ncbi:hypothetical protein OHC33_003381 [Knufia fluminis]|uniref:BTB domain-containing protein n=2 Tax=Knufia TaxID=430999 RepID=A0AAN8ETX4_9EURO|nr:hypothetical protein OHC33_003381 [Knufia fluminis]